jgi:hypothetical protein
LRDIKLLELSRLEAVDLIEKDPKLETPENTILKNTLQRILGDNMNLMKII